MALLFGFCHAAANPQFAPAGNLVPKKSPAPKKTAAKAATPTSKSGAKSTGAKKAPPKTVAKAAPPAKTKETKTPADSKTPAPAGKKAAAPAKSAAVPAPAPAAILPKPTPPPQPPRPIKRPKPPPTPVKMPTGMARLLDPKGPSRKPLIPSGPKASSQRPLGSHGGNASSEAPKVEIKSPFNKRDLERFRQLLLRKRAELVGDVSTMESEALRGQSGSLSNTPSHMAEQGSEAYEQSLSLDLAAADRRLIKEIDDALARIRDGTFGVCQLTGKPIKAERLEELPWARYSIEAARELERQAMRS